VSHPEIEMGTSPGHEISRELRTLRSRFPGLETDERVVSLFEDPSTGKIRLLDLRDNQIDPISYILGGDTDYLVEAAVVEGDTRKTNLVGPFFAAGEIRVEEY
jgi:hypothetical protein